MSRECVIEFRQNGDRLDLEVQATAPDPAHAFGPIAVSRAPLQLIDADMDRMRSGNPTPGLVHQIAGTVSQWLLMPGAAAPLDLPLLLRLNTDPKPPWRLVFSTEKITDETVRQGLSELPIELVQPPGFALPLALQNGVSSIVHRLPKMGAPLGIVSDWPLRILIVRSNPADLGGAVPPADAIRSVILNTKPELAANGRIRVDVLSSENAERLAGRPTARNLLDQVSHPYDMLIYLGHGDLQPSPTRGPPLGLLLLETDDGQNSKQVDAKQLSGLLNRNPIPVVLLVGCLTAAEIPAAMKAQVDAALPGWIRGSQGVAQALVNGQSGVHFVIGMRYKVESQDARLFLEGFFSRLLKGPSPGDLEAALQEGRSRLHFNGAQPVSWAAPVAFRTRGNEPTFPYLGKPPLTIALDPAKEKGRSELWQMLSQINWPLGDLRARALAFLDELEGGYFDGLAAQGALLVAERKAVDPSTLVVGGETPVQVLISLRGQLQVQSLDAIVVSNGGRLVGVQSTPELEASGWELFVKPAKENRIKLHLQSDNPVALAAGPLLQVSLAIPLAPPVVCVAAMEGVRTQPPAPLCSLSNAVIVSAP